MHEFEPREQPLTPEEKADMVHQAHDFAVEWVAKGAPTQRDLEKCVNFIDIATTWIAERDFQIGTPEDLVELAELLVPVVGEEKRILQRKANTDALTGLADKEVFTLARETAESDPETAFLFLDARNFEAVNNTYGQDEGDKEIVKVANFIKSEAEKYGVGERVFRVGGDEFAIIAPKDLVRYLHHHIVDKYGDTVATEDARTTLRGVHADTFSEAALLMVDLKKEEKASKIGKVATKVKSAFKN